MRVGNSPTLMSGTNTQQTIRTVIKHPATAFILIPSHRVRESKMNHDLVKLSWHLEKKTHGLYFIDDTFDPFLVCAFKEKKAVPLPESVPLTDSRLIKTPENGIVFRLVSFFDRALALIPL